MSDYPAYRTPWTTSHRHLGSDLRVRTYPAQGPSRGTILAIHGFRGDHHGLDLLVRHLPGYTIVVPDLPGFGDSTAFTTARHDAATYATVIEALRTDLGLPDTATLLGHSFGSIVAAQYAAAHPGAFAHLVLVNPICEPALEGRQAVFSRLAAGYYAAGRMLPGPLGLAVLRSRLVVDIMSTAMGTSGDPATQAYVVDQHRRYFSGFANRAILQEAFASSIRDTVRDVAPAIRTPTLLVVGELDDLGSVPGQYSLAALFAQANIEVLAGVGHLIHYERPGTTARLVDAFLAAEPAG
ncbi:alpha/beta fold hydrolase [Arthrobacter sp. JSM 101049]|uniref:alpha/beta fold hydrolase n=1 Tax=Arthrobacter sp. JSM 101049 TaxID=929097 RepID=UPI003562FD32